MTITTDGAVIENVIINGTLTVKADNVTIKNYVIQNFSWWGIEGENSPTFALSIATSSARAAQQLPIQQSSDRERLSPTTFKA